MCSCTAYSRCVVYPYCSCQWRHLGGWTSFSTKTGGAPVKDRKIKKGKRGNPYGC